MNPTLESNPSYDTTMPPEPTSQESTLIRQNRLLKIVILITFPLFLLITGALAYFAYFDRMPQLQTILPTTNNPVIEPSIPAVINPTAMPTAILTTAPKASYSESTGISNQMRYVSPKLGISFLYLTRYEGDHEDKTVKEEGQKIYLYTKGTEPTHGQSIEVFTKDRNESLETAIRRVIAPNLNNADCTLKISSFPHLPSNFQKAVIESISGNSANLSLDQFIDKAHECSPYARSNGERYFLTDTSHPDKFVFFSIGQEALMGSTTKSWQDTINFID